MKRRRKRPIAEIPLTSTADVAFLLLIFFLVAASSQTDTGRNLDLPGTVEQGANTEASQNPQLVITPTVMAIDGEVLSADANLVDELKRRLGNARELSERVVMLASDGNVTYQRWSDTVSAIELAGGIPAPQMEAGDSALGGNILKGDAP